MPDWSSDKRGETQHAVRQQSRDCQEKRYYRHTQESERNIRNRREWLLMSCFLGFGCTKVFSGDGMREMQFAAGFFPSIFLGSQRSISFK